MNKQKRAILLAHEMGHALIAHMFEEKYDPIAIEICKPSDPAQAYCHFTDEKTSKAGNTSGVRSNRSLVDLTDLGGLFGELLYRGEWDPWGSRTDIDNFTCANKKRTSGIVHELFEWMWNDRDELSFFEKISEHKERKMKYESTLDVYDTMYRLPLLYQAYEDFLWKINRKEFKNVVDTLAGEKEVFVEGDELRYYLNRIYNREDS